LTTYHNLLKRLFFHKELKFFLRLNEINSAVYCGILYVDIVDLLITNIYDRLIVSLLFIYLFIYQFVLKIYQCFLSTFTITLHNFLRRVWTCHNPDIICPVISSESDVTSRSLSPTVSLPSRAAAPSPLILVTKILGSPGTYGLSLPPRMLKPSPLPEKKE